MVLYQGSMKGYLHCIYNFLFFYVRNNIFFTRISQGLFLEGIIPVALQSINI